MNFEIYARASRDISSLMRNFRWCDGHKVAFLPLAPTKYSKKHFAALGFASGVGIHDDFRLKYPQEAERHY